MKLRMKGNSIRLRLTQNEVAALAAGEKIVETVEFDDTAAQNFSYELLASETVENVYAAFAAGKISVFIPKSRAEGWSANDHEVGVYNQTDAKLKIAIEKDFSCLAPRPNEDESDNFPHPKTDKNC